MPKSSIKRIEYPLFSIVNPLLKNDSKMVTNSSVWQDFCQLFQL